MNPKTIEEIVAQLNISEAKATGVGFWTPVAGVQALISVSKKYNHGLLGLARLAEHANNELDFHPNSGLLVKAFINSATGEIKLFPAKFFGYPEKEI